MTYFEQLKEFLKNNRELYFKKYPHPSRTGARGLWRSTVSHLANCQEDFQVSGKNLGGLEDIKYKEILEKLKSFLD